jgi:hypothetical protein
MAENTNQPECQDRADQKHAADPERESHVRSNNERCTHLGYEVVHWTAERLMTIGGLSPRSYNQKPLREQDPANNKHDPAQTVCVQGNPFS